MAKKVLVMVAVLLAFVALPFMSSAAAIITEVVLSHTDMYAEMFDGSGNGRPTATTDGDNYRKWDALGLSTTSAKFVMYKRDGSPLFELPNVTDFSIAFNIDSQRVGGGQISPVSTSYEIILNSTTGTKTLTGEATPNDVILGTDKAYYKFDFSPETFPNLLTSDSVQKITFTFTFNKTASGTVITVYDILSQRPYDPVVDEDYGYQKPDSPNTDEGLSAGGNLLDQMVDTVDEFNATVNEKTQVLIDNVNQVKPVIDGVFGIIPLPITLCVSGVVVFLVIRKVVGR